MIEQTVYQQIFDELSKYLTENWNELIVYLEYGDASYSFSFYVKKNDEYVKCYDLPGVSDKDLEQSFRIIDGLISKERRKNKDTWTNMTMIIDRDGNMHTDFDYTDLSSGTYKFKRIWKEKYLK